MQNRKVRFVLMSHEGDQSVLPEETARTLGIVDDASLLAAFPENAEWCSVSLLPATKRIEAKIERETYVRDEVLGVRKDDTLLGQKRAANLVEGWTGFPVPFSEEAYLDLSPNVGAFLDQVLLGHMYPSALANPDFFQTWRKSQPGSAQANT
jgi:hypothetical protein